MTTIATSIARVCFSVRVETQKNRAIRANPLSLAWRPFSERSQGEGGGGGGVGGTGSGRRVGHRMDNRARSRRFVSADRIESGSGCFSRAAAHTGAHACARVCPPSPGGRRRGRARALSARARGWRAASSTWALVVAGRDTEDTFAFLFVSDATSDSLHAQPFDTRHSPWAWAGADSPRASNSTLPCRRASRRQAMNGMVPLAARGARVPRYALRRQPVVFVSRVGAARRQVLREGSRGTRHATSSPRLLLRDPGSPLLHRSPLSPPRAQ